MVDGDEDELDYDDEYDDEYYDDEDDDDAEDDLMETGIDPEIIVRLHNVTTDNEDDRFPCPRAMTLFNQLKHHLSLSLNPHFA